MIIDENSPNFIKNPPSTYYAGGLVGGLTGVLVDKIDDLNTNWKDKDGKNKKILIINTTHFTPPFAYGNWSARIGLKKLLSSQHIDESVKEITFEEIIGIITNYNLN